MSETIDYQNPLHQAKHLARYISCPSTIRAHCMNFWGRAPSIDQIKNLQNLSRGFERQVDNPRPQDGYHPRMGSIPLKRERTPSISISDIRENAKTVELARGKPIGRAILEAVGDAFGVSLDELTGKQRFQRYMRPRFMAIKLLADVKNGDGLRRFSYPHIGDMMGGRDHSTVIHALRRFDDIAARDDEYAVLYASLRDKMAVR